MEVAETQTCPSYDKGPPWLFKGSALYQLHLVKAEIAQSFIPKELRLVEAFGYTLGGFFLAHYDDSPAGSFDELVVIAGIVWNPPTSCAWASRVLVNSHKACRHGRKFVGLPSHVARFSKVKGQSSARQGIVATSEKRKGRWNSFLDMIGFGATTRIPESRWDIQVTEISGSTEKALCNISLSTDAMKLVTATLESKSGKKWLGPAIQMSLPNFSGRTEDNPNLLKYFCQINCRVRMVEPAKISGPATSLQSDQDKLSEDLSFNSHNLTAAVAKNDALQRSISVLLSKPILALQFNFLQMQVEAPTIVSGTSKDIVLDS